MQGAQYAGPVAVIVGVEGRGEIPGAIDQHRFGLAQGEAVLVHDVVAGRRFAVLGNIEQVFNGLGEMPHLVGGSPAPGEIVQLVIAQADRWLWALCGGEVLGHPVEGVDIGFFDRSGLGAGEAHHHEDKAIFGHLIRRSRFFLPILIGNERKIALVEIFGTVEGGDLAQHVFVLLAKHLGNFQGSRDRLALMQADEIGRGKGSDAVHGVIPRMRCS